MKDWFNEQGTVTGWQAIGRMLIACIVYAVGVLSLSMAIEDHNGWGFIIFIPAFVFYMWLVVATAVKRFKAFGFVGRWYNLFFPNLTNASYPVRCKCDCEDECKKEE